MLKQFYQFLVAVDRDFPTPLSKRVDLMDYARKLTKLGFVATAIKNEEIIGAVAIYCNDFDSRNAYIPLVAVKKEYRGQKISRALIICSVNYAKGLGFNKVGIQTENPIALQLYKSLGFKIMDDSEERKYLELNLDLSEK